MGGTYGFTGYIFWMIIYQLPIGNTFFMGTMQR
jgi:hypothetical protein